MNKLVGSKLRETRKAKGLTLEEAAQSTHIRIHYLEAMERGDFGALPSRLQVKGFLRAYGGFLGVDAEALIESLDRDPWEALPLPNEEVSSEGDDTDSPTAEASDFFATVGQRLSERREILGLSLEDVEQHTRVRKHYLKALESGDLEALPSPVQGRGMLKNYASFLGLDTDELLLLFAEGLQARRAEHAPHTSTPSPKTGSRPGNREPRFFTRDVLLGSILALSLVVFIVWGTLQVTTLQPAETPEATLPSIAAVLLPSPTPTVVPTPTSTLPSPLEGETTEGNPPDAQPQPAATDPPLPVAENLTGAVQVQIIIRQRSWMRITVDGKVEFEGRVAPGSAYAFAGDDYVEISTGNGAGLQVLYNDLDLGTLGDFGEVVNFVITIHGVQTPTPTLTPTPTETPEATTTATPTATPAP